MARTPTGGPKDPLAGARRGRWLLLGTAVAQLAGPLLVGFEPSGSEPVVVPPGPFFAIWGAVTAGCLAAAVRGLPLRRATSPPYRDVHLPLSAAQLGFVAWLAADGPHRQRDPSGGALRRSGRAGSGRLRGSTACGTMEPCASSATPDRPTT